MFHYFGYGSNLHVVSLRAKGVEPLSSEPAVLEGWRLAFDIPDFFPIEGGTGNIQPADGESVHGVLHACRDADLAKLDQLEALGVTYRRVESSVTTYGGRHARAYVYVGLPEILAPGLLPSERYRNILVRGASAMRLDHRYVERLRAMPVVPRVAAPPFEPPAGQGSDGLVVDGATLASMPHCTALAGHVFDMRGARASHAYLRALLGGRDATLLFLRRMDTSEGRERWEHVVDGTYDAQQRAYLDAYLREFAREYLWVGRVQHRPDSEGPPTGPVVRIDAAPEPPPSRRRSWLPTHAMTSRPPTGLVVAPRAVLDESDQIYRSVGNENAGFLSETFGFMPRETPRTSLPASHAAWDQVAAELPALYRTLGLRRAIEALPILDAGPDHLGDEHLLRAVTLLGMLSHAYQYVETHPPERAPEALAGPWATVRERLGRDRAAALSYLDLIVYNWRLVDPEAADPMRVENLRLLVPTVDTQEERVFYLTQTEILAHASPIVAAIVRAQEAVVLDDREALESALITITTSLQRIVRESLPRIDPSSYGRTHVDPVVWAKGVAPFAVPIQEGVQGPSGTSSPIFNTLDVFFGRKKYETFLGREIHALRTTYPPLWRSLIASLHEVSVVDYVARRGDAHLQGLLSEAVAEYAGPSGFLGRHRMKVYGFLELAFKVGRSVTIGGFKGVFRDRTWDQVDGELERSREERTKSFPQTAYHVRVKRVTPEDPGVGEGVSTVVLDVAGTGIRYEAGDRCGILPESAPELIARTLEALGARGDERVSLTPEWREAVQLRRGYEDARWLTVEELLRFGRIRPVLPRVAEALHARTQDRGVEHQLHAGTTDRWELWDLIGRLRASAGLDPGALLVDDALARVVPPETFRMYSISSVMSAADTGRPSELHLTVGQLRYQSDAADGTPGVERLGTCSTFLRRASGRDEPITMIIQHPARFALPRSARTPIVMIAGGTGLSPFRGFLVERGRQLAAGEAWLFLGLRSRAHFACEDELAPHVRASTLELRIALSRDDAELEIDRRAERPFRWRTGRRARVPALLLEPETAARLEELLLSREEGGKGAQVYVCGRTSFARAAIASLEEILRRHSTLTGAEREREVRDRIARLIADGRLSVEVFSGEAYDPPSLAIDASELAMHNDHAHGHWMAIEGRVYDVSEFLRRHPGGARILRGYAGMDATDGYARSHHGRTEIDAMREMYLIGALRRLELGGATASDGQRTISLAAVHRAWVQLLFLLVEMQNALRNDHALQDASTTRDEPARPRSPYKLQRGVETHHRFLRSYLDVLVLEAVPNVAAISQPFFAPDVDPFAIREALADLRERDDAVFGDGMIASLYEAVRDAADEGSVAAADRVARAIATLESLDATLLATLKEIVVGVVRAFERSGREVVDRDAGRVAAGSRTIVEEIRRYHEGVRSALGGTERWIASAPIDRAPEDAPSMTMVLSTDHWTLEEDAHARVVVLRRTGTPFADVDDIVRANDQAMACFRAEHRTWGVVVDMRHAPRRNDAEFENAMRHLRDRIGKSFARVALVLESAAGVLQVNRIARDEGASDKTFATLSEPAATRFARGG